MTTLKELPHFLVVVFTWNINFRMVLEILLSWFVTLPVAAVFSGGR
ncbi:MAG: inorganic phosphate transporter [Candidatus Brocadiaceae bacterium]|nr:inorganic phosphate transporter [Candidatus Brocadiaceae bacterium]